MGDLGHKMQMTPRGARVIVLPEANSGLPLKGDFERMAKRRHQNPKPFKKGNWWWVLIWDTVPEGDSFKRKRVLKKLAPAAVGARQVAQINDELVLAPINQGLDLGAAINFKDYVEKTYIPAVLPLRASSTQARSRGVIDNYLLPAFGNVCLRDITKAKLQMHFTNNYAHLSRESRDKIRDVLSSILASAVKYGWLRQNPAESVELPPERRGKRLAKPHVTQEQFEADRLANG